MFRIIGEAFPDVHTRISVGSRAKSLRLFLLQSLLMAIYLTASTTAQAQCYPLKATPDELGYRYRSNRCEGLYDSNVSSGGSLQVVSLLADDLNFTLSPRVVLEVAPASYLQTPINVRAVPLPIKTYYRMDASVRAGGTLVWPVADVLYKVRLTPAKLGVYGWYGTESDMTFVPLRVMPSGSTAAAGQIVLGIRATVDINKAVSWRWAAFERGECSSYGGWQNATSTNSNGTNMVRIPISNINNNYICMEVRAKERTTGNWLAPLVIKIQRS